MNTESSQQERIDRAVAAVRERTPLKPRVALVLGSGLGSWAETVEDATRIPFGEIPSMPQSRVAGHAGNLVLGRAEGIDVVAMQGRVHLYEGHSSNDAVFGARLMIALGAKQLIITNAAGGIAERFKVGDLMLIEDHLNLTGMTPLMGINEESLGPRFVDMTTAYDAGLRALAEEGAKALGIELAHGVYAGLLGPSYETPAEIRMLHRIGADAVGMSTVLEVIAARHMGARVLGLSCITNAAAGLGGETLNHEEVQQTADRVRDRFVSLLGATLRRMG